MQNDLFEKEAIPKAYMKMALLPVMIVVSMVIGLHGVISAQFVSDIFTMVVAFVLFKVFLWKEIIN